jgi:citrate synthase
MRLLRRWRKRSVTEIADEILKELTKASDGESTKVPGFGQRFGGVDPYPVKILRVFRPLSESRIYIPLVIAIHERLREQGFGVLWAGMAAAAALDLGFHPRMGCVIVQIAGAAGLGAHAMEYLGMPITALPSVDDDKYEVSDARKEG